MSKTKYYYHATAYENLDSILENGIKASFEGIVYMTEKEEDALKFLFIRGIKHIITFKIKIKNPKDIIETFDHSYDLFKCRCFGYYGNISTENIEAIKEWRL